MIRLTSKRRKRSTGSALSEFGPAFIFLLLFLLFPIINMLGLGLTYFSCNVLNDLQVRQACLVSAQEAQDPNGPVCGVVVNDWLSSGLGQYVNPIERPTTVVSYKNGAGNQDVYVIVTTKVQCRPFVDMPMFAGIPGLGAPMDFTISKEGYCENPRVFNQSNQ